MVDESIKNIVKKLGDAFINDINFVFDENLVNQLDRLCNNLKEIISKGDTYSTDDKHQLIGELKSFQINLLRLMLIQFVSPLPSSVLKNILDTILYQILIEMEISENENDNYFQLSLNYLTADVTIDYINGNRPNNILDDRFLEIFCTIGNRAMWNKIKQSYGISVTRRNIPTFFQLNSKTDRLLHSLLNYLNVHFSENPMSATHIMVFTWVHGMMDIIAFVPFFINAGYHKMVLEWFSIESNKEKISMRTWRESFDLVHNLARHEAGVLALNEFNALSILKTWKERYLSELTLSNDENSKDILVLYYMCYALLLEPLVLKQEDATDIHLALDYILDRGMKAFEMATLRYGPYNVSEFLAAIAKLTVNDNCLLYMLERDNLFEFLIDKFLKFNHLIENDINNESFDLNSLICSLLYTMFWSISFQVNYHSQLENNTEFIRCVRQASKIESNDELLKSIKKSAIGILFNLDVDQESIENMKKEINDHTNDVKVMLSYSHKDSSFCRKLVNSLENKIQADLWVDFNKLEPPYEDDWQEIAQAITNCDVILMIVTANYCSSKSCRREVIHADKRMKTMIPIYFGSQYEPDDWFEIRVGSATWVRFGGMKSDEEVIETLVKLINGQRKLKKLPNTKILSQNSKTNCDENVAPNTISPSIIDNSSIFMPTSVQTVSSKISNDERPVEQWTSEEVQQWLDVPSSILQLSSGRALLVYAELILYENNQQDEYERTLRDRGLTRQQWANLIHLFKTLPIVHGTHTPLKSLSKKGSSNQVKVWFEQQNLPKYLIDTFTFVDEFELFLYAKMITNSQTRIQSEYDRLRIRIQTQCNGQDLLQLDEYVRFVRALMTIVHESQ